jgi:hypothetical protein
MARTAVPLWLALIVATMGAMGASRGARAQSSAGIAVDVSLPPEASPRRIVTVEWNPLTLLVGKVSGNVVLVPVSHHALVVTPFCVSTTTAPIYVFDDSGNATQVPQQRFHGFGGELGYRYYSGEHGPRGWFAGPSLILGWLTATAQDGARLGYLDYGLAADLGYQMLVGDSLSLSLGAGVQYTRTSKAIPNQQFPADTYSNNLVRPRALLSLGWAF